MEREAVYQRLGGNIRRAREERDLNQGELAELIGMTRTSITNLETGRQGLQVYQLLRIARALSTSLDNLIDDDLMSGPSEIGHGPSLVELPQDLAALVSNLQRRLVK